MNEFLCNLGHFAILTITHCILTASSAISKRKNRKDSVMTINTGLEEDFQIAAQTHASDDDATGIKWPTWRRSIWLYFLHYIKEIMLADKVEILVRRPAEIMSMEEEQARLRGVRRSTGRRTARR